MTFSGSVLAWGKLSEKMTSRAVVFGAQRVINALLLLAAIASSVLFVLDPSYTSPYLFALIALSLILGEAGLKADRMETSADVTLDKVDDGFAITSIHLTLKAKIPGADQAKFEELAGKAKVGCPVSKVLNTKITLDATLES